MKFRTLHSLILLVALTSAHAAPIVPAYIADAVNLPGRPVADRETDAERKPAELLAFAGIQPEDKVADLIPGGGYFTRLFQRIVGAQGRVFAVVPQGFAGDDKRLAPLKALIAAPGNDNVALLVRPYAQIDAGVPLDLVWTAQNYHDIYGEVGPFAVAGSSGAEQAATLDVAVFQALKPGGVFIVIDHAAKAGSGGADARTLHRIDAATVIAQVTAVGFVLEARSDVLANPQDAHDRIIFAPEIRGHTDRFVLKFRKPRA